LVALPFWYLRQNLDNGSIEEITTIANIFEKVLSFHPASLTDFIRLFRKRSLT
jgi:hypothetical protein